jgi:AraC-like DNA-binding protein
MQAIQYQNAAMSSTFDPHTASASEGPPVIVAVGSQETELVSGPHRHPRGQLCGSLRGLLSLGVEQGMWVVPAIHAVRLPPHHLHHGRSHGPFHGWSAYVAEEACHDLPSAPCAIRTSGLLKEAVLRAGTWTQGEWSACHGHVADIILDEIRNLPVEPFGLPLPRDARLLRIAQAIIADPADARDLDLWASWGAVSSRTLSRRFVAETGFNFTAWRQRARLMRSLEMLADDVPVQAVALDLGYSTASAFISQFKRSFGETPAAYRRHL